MTSSPHAVNVPFISSYKGVKVVIRTEFINMTIILSMRAVYFFFNCCFFFLYLKLNSILFLKEIVLVRRNCCITMSEIELVFRRAEFRCSGSLYSMLLFKKIVFDSNFQSISFEGLDISRQVKNLKKATKLLSL